jgi:penicillin-binding protein 1B
MAAQFYFGRPLDELSVNQLAMLAGLVRGPSYYDPRRAPQRCLRRRNLVLDAMVQTGKLDPKVAARQKTAPLGVTPTPLFRSSRYPAFMDLVRKQLGETYRDEDLHTAGLQIFTTLDPQVQAAAESAAIHGVASLEGNRARPSGSLQTAIVVTAADTGEVLALVGGRDPKYAGYDHALDARRQIGSLVKPAVYLTALSDPQRYNVITPLDDAPITWRKGNQTWTPHNYEGISHGIVPMYVALAHSYNQATVRLGLQLGIPQVKQRLHALGIQRDLPDYPSLLLGAVGLSPFEVAQMYQTIAAKGFRAPLRAIREVLTHDGKRLTRYGLAVQPAVDPKADYLLTYLLTQVTRIGTAAGLSGIFGPGLPLAGKTGTTNDLRDSWFAGFGGDRVAVVWVGRDDNASTGLTGATGAMRIWADVMRQLDPQPVALDPPEGVDWRWVNADGKLTDPKCDGAAAYPFITGTGPQQYQACHGSAAGYETLRRWGIK